MHNQTRTEVRSERGPTNRGWDHKRQRGRVRLTAAWEKRPTTSSAFGRRRLTSAFARFWRPSASSVRRRRSVCRTSKAQGLLRANKAQPSTAASQPPKATAHTKPTYGKRASARLQSRAIIITLRKRRPPKRSRTRPSWKSLGSLTENSSSCSPSSCATSSYSCFDSFLMVVV